ncbi:MAG: glycine zipper domain-containing protein [Planctomycetales bacterium]
MPDNVSARFAFACSAFLSAACLLPGCASPYHADRGALVGGLTGAGIGTLVGSGGGHPVAGALIGGGVGTLTGAVIGDSIDKKEARRQAEIEAAMGRPLPPGALMVDDVIAMTQAGVSKEVIASHVRAQGVAATPTAHDLIRMQQAGVDATVMQAMQATPAVTRVVQAPLPPPVIVEEHYYPYPPPPPWWHRPRYHRPPPRPGISFEFYSRR